MRYRHVNYRLLYFFHGNQIVVLTHGLTKEREVSPREIDKALALRKRFESDPESHTVMTSEMGRTDSKYRLGGRYEYQYHSASRNQLSYLAILGLSPSIFVDPRAGFVPPVTPFTIPGPSG